ncbi:MAG: phage tail protein [Thaumarchaeota archaeon]|nr:phage tail protein [Nitrososphaerota archaeon]
MSAISANPYDAFHFTVEIEGISKAVFTECVLPAVSIDVIEYRDGADLQNNIHKLPGLVRYDNLILRNGLTSSTDLWTWFNTFVQGTGATKSITVSLLDGQRNQVYQWSFANAWPVKFQSPVLDGKRSALAIETLEIAVEGMIVKNLGQST